MRTSFIVTTYNIEAYVRRCLDSVAEVAVPGDEIIIVDDGSSDQTVEIIRDFCAHGACAKDVTCKPVLLGQNTMGGVGIAGNIGLDMARCETVFFVDGDDWLDPAGFRHGREVFAQQDVDILILNYQEFDEKNARYHTPADEARWSVLTPASDPQQRQLQAVSMIAVPWRKFYRREFLNDQDLRFPEGDFFFEDNPFHWAVCLKTDRIAFLDVTLCYHRVNRPGQTMASTGRELTAFIDHFETIVAALTPEQSKVFYPQAVSWLLGNMSWHLGRLHPKAAPGYFRRAETALKAIDADIFDGPALADFADTDVWLYALFLREQGWGKALEYFLSQSSLKRLEDVKRNIEETQKQVRILHEEIGAHVTATRNILIYDEFHTAGRSD